MAAIKLIITSPHHPPRELPLSASVSIGRSADNTIHVDDPGVARYHAMIEKRGTGFWLSDLGTTNGTVVNGAKLAAEHPLQDGDTISLGSGVAIRVAAPNGQPAAAPAANTESPAASSDAAAPAESGVPVAYVAVGGITVFILLAFVGIAMFVVKNKGKEDTAKNSYSTPTPAISKTTLAESATPTPAPVKTVTLTADTATGIEALVGKLAGQLSGKGNYVFDSDMIAAIAAQTTSYRVDVTAQVREYKLPVDRAFSNAKGLNPLFGHILALSQSRYGQASGSGVGIWQLPPAIAQENVQAGESLSALTPQRSADIAAAHLHDLLTTFEPQDFMYALACFGQTGQFAGTLNQRLQAIDPNERRDFWKQVKAGIVPRDGAEKVVRFFAAGIVGEYPKSFGLTTATAFSDL